MDGRRTTRMTFLVLCAGIIIAMVSCKTIVNPDDRSGVLAPSLFNNTDILSIPLVMRESVNIYAQKTVAFVDTINGVLQFSSFFRVPEYAEKVNTNTSPLIYTWPDDSLNITWTFNETSAKYWWIVSFDGTSNETVYAGHTFATASQNTLTDLGEIIINSEDGLSDITCTWDAKNPEAKLYSYTNLDFIYEAEQYDDKHGKLSVSLIENSSVERLYDMEWNPTGSGTFTRYSNGVIDLIENW